MAYDQHTVERVRRLLSDRHDIVEKRMIGGLCFMVSDNMCCGVTGDSLMVRVGPEARDWALSQPHTRPMEFAERPLSGFIRVDPGGIQSDADLLTWVQRGLDFASTLPAKKPTPKKPRV